MGPLYSHHGITRLLSNAMSSFVWEGKKNKTPKSACLFISLLISAERSHLGNQLQPWGKSFKCTINNWLTLCCIKHKRFWEIFSSCHRGGQSDTHCSYESKWRFLSTTGMKTSVSRILPLALLTLSDIWWTPKLIMDPEEINILFFKSVAKQLIIFACLLFVRFAWQNNAKIFCKDQSKLVKLLFNSLQSGQTRLGATQWYFNYTAERVVNIWASSVWGSI